MLNYHLVTVLAALCIAAAPAMPMGTTNSVTFRVGVRDTDRFRHAITVSEPGCVLASISSWTANTGSTKATRLAVIINSTDQSGYYARKDSVAPLVASYAIDAARAARKMTWTISLVNFTKLGTATGRMTIETPPTAMPCEFAALVGRTRGTASLRWRYTGRATVRRFVAEQSENGSTWNAVTGCTLTPNSSGSYSCNLSGLTSGRTYQFRVCSITSTTASTAPRCDTAQSIRAPAISLKVS